MTSVTSLPGDHLDTAKMPGHWLLLRRLLRDGEARARVSAMKNAFQKRGPHLRAITIVGRKA